MCVLTVWHIRTQLQPSKNLRSQLNDTYEGADEVKNNCCLLERLFRVKKNKVFRFEIDFFFTLEIFMLSYYENEESDDNIGGSTKTIHYWIKWVGRLYDNLVVFPDKNLFATTQDYRTVSFVFSQRFSLFTPIIPRADWEACGSCRMAPLCFSAYISVRDFFKLISVFKGRCLCSEWQKRVTTTVLPSCILAPF